MAFNIFRKKEEVKKEPLKEPEATKKTVAKTASIPAKKEGKKVSSFSLSLPHITEKAGLLQGQNQYVFKVVPGATKYGVRDSVEVQYGVQVAKVRMIAVPSKSIRVGKNMGKRPGYKKAIVTLKEGYTIAASA